MNRGPLILLSLMVAVPLAVLGWLGVRLRTAEQAVTAGLVDQLYEEGLRAHARTVAGVVERYERETLSTLETAPLDPAGLRELLARSPLVSQYFVVDPLGALVFPAADASGNAGEQEFIERTRDIWRNGELTSQPPPATDEANESAPARSVSKGKVAVQNVALAQRLFGWYVWHWGSDIHLLIWTRRPDGFIVGAEISRPRLVGDIIAALPDSPADEVAFPATRTELRNSRSEVIYGLGALNAVNATELRATLPLDYPLNAWSLAYYVNPAELQQSIAYGPGSWFRLATQLGAVAIALSALAAYLYRENARTAREAAQRVTFVNQVSHELKTPLTNIRMYAEMLEDNLDAADEPSRRHVGVLVSESQRLSRMIANILTFSRKERHALKLRPSPGVVDACVRAVLDQFRPALDARGVEVAADLNAPNTALIDADVVEQIAGNLVSNVEKYAASGKLLSVSTQQTGDAVTITVADAGPGIPPKEQARIFDPFYRVSDKLTDGVAGTGIGLTIARELARLHGGDLALAASERGACFRVTLRCPRTGGSSCTS